jgi:hypothetical protein
MQRGLHLLFDDKNKYLSLQNILDVEWQHTLKIVDKSHIVTFKTSKSPDTSSGNYNLPNVAYSSANMRLWVASPNASG